MPPQNTIEVPLSRGLVAIVDEDDADLVLPYKWSATRASRVNVYAFRNVRRPNGKKTVQLLHRFLMGVTDPIIQVDHKNGDGLDCTRKNMRIATNHQNRMNIVRVKSGTSPYRGVCWDKREGTWKAQIGGRRFHRNLGWHKDPVDAAMAYDRAAREMYGEFARLNFPDE